MDTMVSYRNDNIATQFLTKADIKAIAPKVFCTAPTNPNLTDRYGYVGTEKVIDDLASRGWLPVEAKQQKMRKESSIRSFHIVTFQNPKVAIRQTDYVDEQGRNYAFSRVKEQIDEEGNIIGYVGYDRYGHSFPVFKKENVECYPRIILTNSYDGFNAFTFRVGLFRLVCSNGLVVCTDSFVDIKIRHTKYSVQALDEVLMKAIGAVDSQIGTFNDMRTITLSDEQKTQFALNALRIRKHLPADAPMNADEEGINGKKARKMRGIKSFAKDIDINQQLYAHAMEYLPMAV